MDRNEMGKSVSNDIQQQRPEPRFKDRQVVVIITDDVPVQIEKTLWILAGEFYLYEMFDGEAFKEHELRPLSVDEIGSNRLTELAQRLLAADARVETSQRVSDSLLAKLAASRGLCGRMLTALTGIGQSEWIGGDDIPLCWCGGIYRADTHSHATRCLNARAVIAEAEAEMKGGE